MSADLLRDLAFAKVAFQLRAIEAVIRGGDPALAAATGTAKTRNAAECEASQSGGSASERNAQPPSGDISND